MSNGGKLGINQPKSPYRESRTSLFCCSFPVSHHGPKRSGKQAIFVSFPVSHTRRVGNGNEAQICHQKRERQEAPGKGAKVSQPFGQASVANVATNFRVIDAVSERLMHTQIIENKWFCCARGVVNAIG